MTSAVIMHNVDSRDSPASLLPGVVATKFHEHQGMDLAAPADVLRGFVLRHHSRRPTPEAVPSASEAVALC